MEITKQIFYAFTISLLFLLGHMLITYFKLSNSLTFVFTMLAMILAQVAVYTLLKNNSVRVSFLSIFYILCLTQAFCVILLSLNSAFNPYVDTRPVNYLEVLISLIIFALVLPLVVTAVIWYSSVKAKMAR